MSDPVEPSPPIDHAEGPQETAGDDQPCFYSKLSEQGMTESEVLAFLQAHPEHLADEFTTDPSLLSWLIERGLTSHTQSQAFADALSAVASLEMGEQGAAERQLVAPLLLPRLAEVLFSEDCSEDLQSKSASALGSTLMDPDALSLLTNDEELFQMITTSLTRMILSDRLYSQIDAALPWGPVLSGCSAAQLQQVLPAVLPRLSELFCGSILRAKKRAPRDKSDSLSSFTLATLYRLFERTPEEAARAQLPELLCALLTVVDGATARILEQDKLALQHLSVDCLGDLLLLALRTLLQLSACEGLGVGQLLLNDTKPACLGVLGRLRKHRSAQCGELVAEAVLVAEMVIQAVMACHRS